MMKGISSAFSTGLPFPCILINNGVLTRDNLGLSILFFVIYHIFQENVTSLGLIFNKLWNLSSRIYSPSRIKLIFGKASWCVSSTPLVRLLAFFHNLL